jgi:hypothetical protein
MRKIGRLFLIFVSFVSCNKTITGFYKLSYSNIPRLYISIELKKDRTHNYFVSEHGYSDSIFGNWAISNNILYLTDSRMLLKPNIDFIEISDSSITGFLVEIKEKSDNLLSNSYLINVNNKDTITDSKGELFLANKIFSIKTNKLITGIDTTYLVKKGNIIKINYKKQQLNKKFDIEDKWFVKRNRLTAINNDSTIIKLKKNAQRNQQ